ncbi:hypothetical protein [Saccharopolyspora flava]|uniref:DUF234 domain-containing protein n=1 Tax=Saccharopolyspora flava TaxID=95161 RepID=A0A1I6TV97_9PSEU|nr:hypothetical protein [Saccharopolyspora flava]SFS93163.1 hypothetical protein SAMN05660874_04296 [Saccharopolyspora flava]
MVNGTINDPAAKKGHEVDLAVFGHDADDRETLLAIGEAKWNEPMGLSHLRRLQEIRDVLERRDITKSGATRLLCFSGAGFSDDLRRAADDAPEVELIDLNRLYHGE